MYQLGSKSSASTEIHVESSELILADGSVAENNGIRSWFGVGRNGGTAAQYGYPYNLPQKGTITYVQLGNGADIKATKYHLSFEVDEALDDIQNYPGKLGAGEVYFELSDGGEIRLYWETLEQGLKPPREFRLKVVKTEMARSYKFQIQNVSGGTIQNLRVVDDSADVSITFENLKHRQFEYSKEFSHSFNELQLTWTSDGIERRSRVPLNEMCFSRLKGINEFYVIAIKKDFIDTFVEFPNHRDPVMTEYYPLDLGIKKVLLREEERKQESQKFANSRLRTGDPQQESEQKPTELKLPALKNSIGMAFRQIPKGKLITGSGEKPDEALVVQEFHIGIYEVTLGEYRQVMGANPGDFQRVPITFNPSSPQQAESVKKVGDDHPVEHIRWSDAVKFCERLSNLPGERAAGRVYRLPTYTEWEYACRAGTNSEYSFGNDVSLLDGFAWTTTNSADQTHPVGKKKPNRWGLYDMHGNVEEWCSGYYDNSSSSRVVRGGSWKDDQYSSAQWRGELNSDYKHEPGIGFRVVMTMVAAP
jgi:formylglycine-generating enzyme required for sulfatase activity